MEVEGKAIPPITNWYVPGVDGKTNTDSESRTAQIPPLDTIAPTPKTLVDKSCEHISNAEAILAMAKHEIAKDKINPRIVSDLHKQAGSDIKRAVELTEAVRPGDAFSRLIADQMAKADDAQRDLHALCDTIEARFGRSRDLQAAQRLMQQYGQEGDEVINLDDPKTPVQEKDFALFKRLWTVCKEEGIRLPDDWTAIKRDKLNTYDGAIKDVVSSLKEQRQKDMLDYKQLMNRSQQAWEAVISTDKKKNESIMSAIRAIGGR